MKKILIRVAVVLLLLLLTAIGYFFFSLNSLVKKGVETIGPRITGVDVRLGAALISPWSGSGKLTGLTVANPPGFTTPYAIRVGSISVSIAKDSILTDTVVINEILITNPELSLEGTLGGNNLSKIMENLKSRSSSKSSGQPPSGGKSKKFVVKSVLISGIKLNAALSAIGQKVQQSLSIPEIRLQNIGSNGGVSASDLAQQILTPLLNASIKTGINDLSKQGIKQLQDQGAKELNKTLQGLFK